MINLLNAEWYKLRKGKSFWTCCICIAASIFLLYGIFCLADGIQRGDVENGTAGLTVTVDGQEATSGQSFFESLTVTEIFQNIAGVFVTVISVIFNTIFVIGEFGNGAVKNFAGKGYSRWKIFAAKHTVCMLATEIMVLFSAALNYALGCIFIGKECLAGNMVRDYVVYTLLLSALIVSINSIAAAISEISRSMAVGIMVAVCIAGGISSLLFSALDLLLHAFSLEPSKYWLTNLISECPISDFGTEIVLRIIIAAVMWFCVSAAAGMWHFHKADIK